MPANNMNNNVQKSVSKRAQLEKNTIVAPVGIENIEHIPEMTAPLGICRIGLLGKLDGEGLVKAVIMAEVLGKPRGKRRGRWGA